MAARSTGASSSPSRQPRSFSTAIERFKPSCPAKMKVTHRTPEVTFSRTPASSSRAKLKIKMTSSANTSMDEITSRLRHSARRSFQITAPSARRKDLKEVIGRPPAGGADYFAIFPASAGNKPTASRGRFPSGVVDRLSKTEDLLQRRGAVPDDPGRRGGHGGPAGA